jgi:hypothetical protein
MKFLRYLLVTLVAGLAALGIALAVALDSGVQTWAVRRAIENRGMRGGSIGLVAIGFNQTELKNLVLTDRGIVLTIPQLHAEFPPLAAALSRRLLVRQVAARGWTLDLRAADRGAIADWLSGGSGAAVASGRDFSLLPSARAAPAGPLPAPFRGIFSRLALPIDLAVAGAELEGDILLPAAPGVPPATLHAIITGGGLGAGQDAQFVFRLSAAPAGAVVSQVTAEGAVSAAMDTPRTFTRLGVRFNAAAFGPQLKPGVKLVADLSATRAGSGESYSVVLSGETKPLLALLAEVPADGQRPGGTWRLDVADEDLSPFLLGRILPNFDLVGEGQFDADLRGADLHLSGGFKASLDRLDAIRPQLGPIGSVGILADFDLTRRGNLWRVDRLTAAVQGAQPILVARSLQPFAFDWTTGELQVADASGDLLGLSLQALPPGWVQVFLPQLALQGDPLRGEIVGSAHNGAVALRSLGSLTVSGVSIGTAGHPFMRDLSGTFAAAGDYTPAGWQLQINSLGLSGGGVHLLDGNAKFGRRAGGNAPLKLEGSVQVDLAALLGQPGISWGDTRPLADPVRSRGAGAQSQPADRVAGSANAPGGRVPPTLSSGTLAADFSASLGEADALEAKLRFTRVTVDALPDAMGLPDVTADLRADLSTDRRLTFRAPLTLARAGRTSDVVLEGALGWGFSGPVFEGTLSGAHLALEDAALLGAPFAGGSKAGLSGTLKLAVSRVDWNQYSVSGLAGEIGFSPVAVTLTNLKGRLNDAGPISLSGQFTSASDADVARAYAWNAAVTVADADLAAWWKKFAPDHPPQIEGKFKVTGQFSGSGASRAEAWDAAQGSCALTSAGGTFRLLATEIAPKANSGNLAMSALRSVASGLGSVIGRHKNAEFSNPAEAAVYTAQAVSVINYDQLSFTVERDSAQDVFCRDFALIAPDLRLTGDGKITHEAGTDFDEQPLEAQLNLSARGKLAAALKYLEVLGAKPDDLGYSASPLPIVVKGTLHKPDTTEVQTALLKIVAARGGDLLNKLLGK